MFASRSVFVHVLRGLAGFGSLIAGWRLLDSHPSVSLALVAFAILALRGCPSCWILGLIETISARARGGTSTGTCVDGSCLKAWPREP